MQLASRGIAPASRCKATLNSPISVGGKFSMEIISMGHTNFAVKVEWMWVQDPKSYPQSL
jgi:hypothetical protein